MNKEKLIQLFENWANEPVSKITPMPISGSDRRYFRIFSESKIAIGVFNPDTKENLAFIEFTKHFRKYGLKVPEIYDEDMVENIYLLQDLGDITLFDFIQKERAQNGFSEKLVNVYKRILTELPKFQIPAAKDFNFSLCYPRASFDKQSMMWDLSYFKYYFLKLAKIPFDEQALEDDFQLFTDYLLKAESEFFLYRDFQSRNIMLKDDEIFFIDYQGGRKGALQYDLASLLFDAKADLPGQVRKQLVGHYISELKKYMEVDELKFRQYFHGFILIRIMQAMGAYGFRGFYEKKAHFLASIPYALENLKHLLENFDLPIQLPTLLPVLKQLTESEKLMSLASEKKKLILTVNSFSYKRGVPVDESGHGGGFVFDCRSLPNPGRYPEYKDVTGKDLLVIEYLKKEKEVDEFLEHVVALIEQSVEKYLNRGFDHLTVNFGCTGGQHRSVYCAEFISNHIKNKYGIEVRTRHREQEMK